MRDKKMSVKFYLTYHFVGVDIEWRKWSIRLKSHLGETEYDSLPCGGLLKQPTLNSVTTGHTNTIVQVAGNVVASRCIE